MSRALRAATALCAAAALLTLSACGDDASSSKGSSGSRGAVASVDGHPITKASYHRWARIKALGTLPPRAGTLVLDPPSYARCIEGERARDARERARDAPRLRRNTQDLRDLGVHVAAQPVPSTAVFRARCQQMERFVKGETMRWLIQARWIRAEAKRLGVEVTDAEVSSAVAKLRKPFRTERAFEADLHRQGMDLGDLRLSERLSLLGEKVGQAIRDRPEKVAEARIRAYFAEHRARFLEPERRDIQMVILRSRRKALEARRALASGTSWSEVTKRLAGGNGGRPIGMTQAGWGGNLDIGRLTFAARRGQLVGPVRGPTGFFVLRVTRIIPSHPASLASARAQIVRLLQRRDGSRRLAQYSDRIVRRLAKRTSCAAGFVIAPYCGATPRLPE